NYTGLVHFTSSDGTAVLVSDYLYTVADQGVHTFVITLKISGTQTITVYDGLYNAISGASTITVNRAAATHFAVSAPVAVGAGAAFTFTVTALDAFNNLVPTYAGTVHFSSTDAAAVLPANTTLALGVGTFTAMLKTSGFQSITATDTVSGSVT